MKFLLPVEVTQEARRSESLVAILGPQEKLILDEFDTMEGEIHKMKKT